ncbi:MAG: leucine-rich repeat protein [Clostridia bacterium]|nr:leucine-rich repeat protein [Clostridia bacterium]
MKKLGILFATVIMLVLFTVSASALDPSGKCGDNVKWSFDESEGKLTISGTGDMTDYGIEDNFSPFMGKSDIKTVAIEKGVTSVGNYAFTFCRGLTKITLPDSVKSLGTCAFANCANVKELALGNGIKTIGALAFDNCDALTKLILPDSVNFIDEYAFQACDGLTEVSLGNGIAALNFTFTDCENLKKVTFRNGIDTIGTHAFSGCRSLENITIPNTVTTIGESAFSGCESLTEIVIPQSVENIGESAFYECSKLKKITVDSKNTEYSNDSNGVLYNKKKTELLQYPIAKTEAAYTIPSGVESIGDHAFANCKSLINMNIPNGVTSVGNYAFFGCSNLKNIGLASSVEVIGNAAFYDCDSITEFLLPQGVTTIGNNAFGSCDNLKKITVPVSVTSIGDVAFVDCVKLTDVHYKGTEEQWKAIKKGAYNFVLERANIHYNSAEEGPHPHTYTSSVTKEATCKEEGIITYICSCGDSYTEKIPVTSHNIIEKIVKADFESDGMRTMCCKDCGFTVSEDVIYKVDTVKLLTEKYTYDGKSKKPEVFLEDVWGTDLKEGEHYTVRYESDGKAPGKHTVTVTLTGTREGEKKLKFSILPGKTSKITATQTTDTIKLKWNKVTGADGYRVYQYNSKTGKYEKIKTLTGTSYTVKKLKAGTTYKVAVKAYTKDGGETIWAASSVSFRTCTKPANPAPKATSSASKATIKWSKVTGATGYVIYMQDDFGDYNKIGSTKSTSYTKKSLKKGRTYYFRVRAYKTLDGKNIYGGYKTVKVKLK